MAGVTITLDDKEVKELERVLLDEDAEDAIKLLDNIKKKVVESQKRICGMHREL